MFNVIMYGVWGLAALRIYSMLSGVKSRAGRRLLALGLGYVVTLIVFFILGAMSR